MDLVWVLLLNFVQCSVFDLDAADSQIRQILGKSANIIHVSDTFTNHADVDEPNTMTVTDHISSMPAVSTPKTVIPVLHSSLRPTFSGPSFERSLLTTRFEDMFASRESAVKRPMHTILPITFSKLSIPLDAPHKHFKQSATDLELEEYIQSEIRHYKFGTAAKIEQFERIIRFIANNDFVGFTENEDEFAKAFKFKPYLLKLNNINYLAHYIIRFGATNFVGYFQMKCSTITSDQAKIGMAFEHLVKTKELEVVVQMVNGAKSFKIDDLSVLSKAVEKKHKGLHFFDFLFFETMKRNMPFFGIVKRLYNTPDICCKFNILRTILTADNYQFHISEEDLIHRRFVLIPQMYPEFFDSLDFGTKYFLAKLAIYYEVFVSFELVLERSPNLLLFLNSKETYNMSLLHFAILKSKSRIVEYILRLAPELALIRVNNTESPFHLALIHSEVEILELFNDIGISYETTIVHNGQTFNGLQYSFLNRRSKCFEYLLSKMGKEQAMAYLLDIFVDRDAILKHAFEFSDVNLVSILANKLDYDLKAPIYKNGDTIGNALIFATPDYKSFFRIKFGLEPHAKVEK